MHKLPILSFSLAILILSCKQESFTNGQYQVEKHYSSQERDSLLADIITYIYKKPKNADYLTRFDPKYRNWYVQSLPLFEFAYYHVSEEGIHYYYLIRPARSTRGNKRGAGGKFKLDQEGNITEFEEVFVTPVIPEQQLRLKGKIIFEEMLEQGNVDFYLGKPNYIEWPDDRLKYDKLKKEWRYDAAES